MPSAPGVAAPVRTILDALRHVPAVTAAPSAKRKKTTAEKNVDKKASIASRDASLEASEQAAAPVDPDLDPKRQDIPEDWYMPVKAQGQRKSAGAWSIVREINVDTHALFRCGEEKWPHPKGYLLPVSAFTHQCRHVHQESGKYCNLFMSINRTRNKLDSNGVVISRGSYRSDAAETHVANMHVAHKAHKKTKEIVYCFES